MEKYKSTFAKNKHGLINNYESVTAIHRSSLTEKPITQD